MDLQEELSLINGSVDLVKYGCGARLVIEDDGCSGREPRSGVIEGALVPI